MGITFGKNGGNGHHKPEEDIRQPLRQAWRDQTGIELPGQIVEGIARAFSEAEEHRIAIWYWNRISYMHDAYTKKRPTPQEWRTGYVLMWEGRMGWNGTLQEGLQQIFTILQDEGTAPFFSQDDVRRRLQPEPHTSMSVGDVIGVDGKKYICLPTGWEELK